ncbi:MAG: HAMP domain-containing histidine kinase [Candidatus Pacebacteria bacterium]|jgi:signal transduction histidine kinase|nr:HAMP domain-containing histidine kinase [Candidatus Paceibacterota bacterium]
MFKKVLSFVHLARENKKLKEEIARRKDIVSANVHQLRTSLTAIKWVLKMLLDGDIGTLTHDEKKYVQKIYDRTERMIYLVSGVLEANKNGNLRDTYTFKEGDIVALIQDTLIDFSGEAFKYDIHIELKKPTERIPKVLMDSDKIRIVLQNLIENALKYGKSGGSITITAKQSGDFLEIQVVDTGIGISEHDKSKIFERFFRAENAKSKSKTGTGLGLYMTRHIIEEHGGSIWFESQQKRGTTFHFTIPVAR